MMATKRDGFTLIELTLSLSFIGILLIATVVVIIQVTHQYSKGVTLKLVNQAGRDLGVVIKRDSASVASVAKPLVAPGDNSGQLGRLCLGSYSYIWSNPAKLRDSTATKYIGTNQQIVMARVPDSSGRYCVLGASGYDIAVERSTATEMLPNDKGNYAIHEVTLDKIPASDTAVSNGLYKITYTIGTNEEGAINSALRCKPPAAVASNFDFCAVNKFELMVEAGE